MEPEGLRSTAESNLWGAAMAWLVIDGYEDEPAAFGVPPYIGFHVRYVCGVLEERRLDYSYITIDEWRRGLRPECLASGRVGDGEDELSGCVLIAGAVVPGKYLRGTPISARETDDIVRGLPHGAPMLCGGWAIRGWRQRGWSPLRKGLFFAVQDTDATLDHFLFSSEWAHRRRTSEQWTRWAHAGASSRAVLDHPDLRIPEWKRGDSRPRGGGSNGADDSASGPLTYEVEVYQGCVRYKRGCRFCIEPKKGVPVWRTPEDVIEEVSRALDSGVRHVRLGGMTDVYTYRAEGVVDLEYPIPDPEPIATLLHGLRQDERLDTLHVDNANPSIIAENIEPSTEITRTLVETLSDGAVLSFGLESADPAVHEENWLNCDSEQLKIAVRHINEYGRQRGPRGLPRLLPGLNFIAGLNGETRETYDIDRELLEDLRSEGMWLRRINIRQVEGEGFQRVEEKSFHRFKEWVRNHVDSPLLAEMLPVGTRLTGVRWEAHDGRIRLPVHIEDASHRDPEIHGEAGVTFGRQVGAYPLLIGVPYKIPLESESDVIVTGHGARSITAVESGLSLDRVTQKQLQAIPGIGEKAAWRLISERAKALRLNPEAPPFASVPAAFDSAGLVMPPFAEFILEVTG